MSQPSFTNFIVKRPWLKNMMTPFANWYCNAAGYRKLGLRYVEGLRQDNWLRKPLGHVHPNKNCHWRLTVEPTIWFQRSPSPSYSPLSVSTRRRLTTECSVYEGLSRYEILTRTCMTTLYWLGNSALCPINFYLPNTTPNRKKYVLLL